MSSLPDLDQLIPTVYPQSAIAIIALVLLSSHWLGVNFTTPGDTGIALYAGFILDPLLLAPA